MQAIIRCGSGRYYCTPIFGRYINKHSPESPFDWYVICFDEAKEKLIQYPFYRYDRKPYLDLMVLTSDSDLTGWVQNAQGYEGVSFLSQSEALVLIQSGDLPVGLRTQCMACDLHEDFSCFRPVTNTADIRKLMSITGSFHDSIITKMESHPNGSLHVLFEGAWGCSVELLFSGDVSYCADSKSPEAGDPYWYESSIALKEGYVYLIDAEIDVADLTNDYAWFKARSMQYRIIPE